MLETWRYSPFEDVLDLEEIFWGYLFGMGVEVVVHTCGYDPASIKEIFLQYGYEPPTPEEIAAIRGEILSGKGPLVRRVG